MARRAHGETRAAGLWPESDVAHRAEPLFPRLLLERGIQHREYRAGPLFAKRRRTDRVAGRAHERRCLGSLAAHVPHHQRPSAVLGVEGVVEVTAHIDPLAGGLIPEFGRCSNTVFLGYGSKDRFGGGEADG